MKKNQIQQQQKNQKSNNNPMRTHLINYLDGVLRGLIAFFIIGIGFYIFLVGFLKVRPLYVFPIVFIVSIIVSPFLSRIKLGEKLLTKYENWIMNLFKIK